MCSSSVSMSPVASSGSYSSFEGPAIRLSGWLAGWLVILAAPVLNVVPVPAQKNVDICHLFPDKSTRRYYFIQVEKKFQVKG